MSALVYGPSQVRLNFGQNHYLLAHLQVATARRFAEGRGFFLTLSGHDDDGRESSVSYWLHPSIPLLFAYDTENDEGDRPEQIVINAEHVESFLSVMDHPLGVLWGFDVDEGRYVPFYDGPPESDAAE
ncbi:hypothetical protein [Mycobacterium paraintracellulare]|uniref:DUF7882 family protein n=1 Tax=Mycobacterium paraintracellulare TaxID=1138383 RepID=UPI001916386F|nr:hypothetical protein [Mycobacterium paraintracellulare]BCP04617.1 hypothetical protein MINTM019_20730 [Mycobacterium paraintracellulare]